MNDNAKLLSAVSDLEAANKALYAAQEKYITIRAHVVDLARRLNITQRAVYIIGNTAWYIDPPGTCQSSHPDGWGITWGAPPVEVYVGIATGES